MRDSNHLSKREFLKLLGGLSLGFLPLMGCFNERKPEKNTPETPASGTPTTGPENTTAPTEAVTEQDVIVLERDDARYAQYNVSYNKRIALLPQYIAVCFTDAGVRHALQLAQQQNLPVSIKSGGHSFEGFSSNNGGLVINLSQMKAVNWNDDGTVTVGPGLLLRELHDQVYAKGKLVPAGSCGGVGIAGLTLGGGYGFFSRKYGFTCDSLVDASLVKADGQVLAAASDKELLWALRGGGNGNFGVVTSLRFKTHPMPQTLHATTIKHTIGDSASFAAILQKWMNLVPQLPPEAFGAFVQNGKTLTLLFTNYGSGSMAAITTAMAEGARSTSSSSSAGKPFTQALKRFYGRAEPLYFKNASCGYYKSFDDIASVATAIFDQLLAHPGLLFQVNTLGGAVASPEFEAASCYPHRRLPFLSELQGYYDRPAQESSILEGFRNIQQLVRGVGVTAQYRNYPDVEFPDWQHAYYGANYEKLRQLKAHYDPGNRFRYPQSIEGSPA
jgi:hypothetical protein